MLQHWLLSWNRNNTGPELHRKQNKNKMLQYPRKIIACCNNYPLTIHLQATVTLPQPVPKQVAHTWLQSVGFRNWFRFLAVSLWVMWVINLAVGCHYFPPGLQLPKTVTRQCCNCNLNPGPSVPESSTLTTYHQYLQCTIQFKFSTIANIACEACKLWKT